MRWFHSFRVENDSNCPVWLWTCMDQDLWAYDTIWMKGWTSILKLPTMMFTAVLRFGPIPGSFPTYLLYSVRDSCRRGNQYRGNNGNNPIFMGMGQGFRANLFDLPSGKRLHNYGKSPFLMGKLTISMAIFNSFLYVYQRVVSVFSSHPMVPWWGRRLCRAEGPVSRKCRGSCRSPLDRNLTQGLSWQVPSWLLGMRCNSDVRGLYTLIY